DPSVSPIHLRIDYRNGILIATDLNSREGILYKNKKRKQLELKEDASFSVGTLDVATSRGAPITASPISAEFHHRTSIRNSRAFLSSRLSLRRRVSKNFSQEVEREVKKKLPFLGISFCLHLVIWLIIADIPFINEKIFLVRRLLTQIISEDDVISFEKEKEMEERTFDEPFLPDAEIMETLEDPMLLEEILPDIRDLTDEISVHGLGQGTGVATGLAGEGVARLSGYTYSEGFRDYINDLRTQGMDVVFVIDSTSSMVPFIDEAKRVVNQLISKLAAIVPNLRLAIVTYRDHGDEYLIRHLDLTSDRYEILNFLEDCQAKGGGDFPEAVYDALYRSVNSLFWRPEANKVIILVGDAPYHEEEEAKLDRLLRNFCSKENKGIVNAVYVGDPHVTTGGDPQEAIKSMQFITSVSGGEFSKVSEYEEIIKHLVHVTFGSQWEKDVNRLLATVQQGRLARVVERKAREGQKEWLLNGLKKVPVSAGIVTALINNEDPSIPESLVSFLEAPEVAAETKWACIYILRKKLGRRVDFDPLSGSEKQRNDILRIKEILIRDGE
ncbi:VWA domain-containing protein, partial [bacterium]|nr:VWA domain-containing protein [bacterium]